MDKATTEEAVAYVIIQEIVRSKYALAVALGIRPIMINNYLKGTRMGWAIAERFKELYNIEITDIYDNRARMTNVG